MNFREKLNEAAEDNAWAYTDRIEAEIAFTNGADWLMQQPLSERLTDEEKDRIRGLLNYVGENAHDSEVRTMRDELVSIFGPDLFKEK